VSTYSLHRPILPSRSVRVADPGCRARTLDRSTFLSTTPASSMSHHRELSCRRVGHRSGHQPLRRVPHHPRRAFRHAAAQAWAHPHIASVHALVASINKAAYVAAKHGVIGLTKWSRLRTPPTALPATPSVRDLFSLLVQKQIDDRAAHSHLSIEEAEREMLREKQPTGRFTSVEDVAALCALPLLPAASNVTGASFPVDGGWTAQ